MRRATLRPLAAAVGVTLALASLAEAQQAPPAWKQGQPAELANSPLSPVPLPPTPTPANQIPLDRVKLPPGFKISVWADGLHNARQMARGDKGTLFVGTRVAGNVYAVVDRGGRREVKVIAKGLSQPSGVAFRDGALFVAEIPRLLKYENIEAHLDSPPAPKVVYEYPKDAHHNWRFLLWGPDGKLYFVSHGRDWMGDDIPNDTLHHAPRPGLHFGYPYCHQGDIVDPDFGGGHSCSEFAPPLLKLGPHVAPIGTRFYTGNLFPPQYRNRLFIAQKGSWNRSERIGYRVMTVELKPGQPPKYEVFADGFHEGDKVLGRPTHIEWMPDGSMLVSDDYHGAIYHITYAR